MSKKSPPKRVRCRRQSWIGQLRRTAVTLIVFAASDADAASLTAVLGRSEYTLQCNANGYILQPDAAGIEAIRKATGKPAIGRGPVYLGQSCDAASGSLGAGKWCWGSGGFVVDLEGATLDFPDQRPECLSVPALDRDCLC